MSIEVKQIPCLDDNYGFLVHDVESGATASIDTPEAEAINAALAEQGWTLTHILNTHHHFDHAGGNEALKAQWGCQIIGAANDAHRIPGIDQQVVEGDVVELGATQVRVLEVPGHTLGHIAYYFEQDQAAFVGDTLFALGCGRMFEGTADQMWHIHGDPPDNHAAKRKPGDNRIRQFKMPHDAGKLAGKKCKRGRLRRC